VLVGIVGALSDEPGPEPVTLVSGAEAAEADEDSGSAEVEPVESSTTVATSPTSTTTAVTSTSSTTMSTTAVTTSTTAPRPTKLSTTQATAAQVSTTTTTSPPSTTGAPTTAASTTAPPTTAAPTTAAPTTLEDHVTPGAFCSPPGATGRSSTGKAMVCSLTNKDGEPYGEGRARWRSP
jgi:hypothetical protein